MAAENSTIFSLNIGDSLINNAWGKGRWEGGSKERRGKEGWHKRRVGGSYKGWREVGSDDVRQTESVNGGREGW